MDLVKFGLCLVGPLHFDTFAKAAINHIISTASTSVHQLIRQQLLCLLLLLLDLFAEESMVSIGPCTTLASVTAAAPMLLCE